MRCLFVLLSLLAAAAGQAQDTTHVLPGVEVTAPRGAAHLAATGRATRLGSVAIRQTGAATVADLLARRGGVFVRAYGPGGLASPSLRGTGAAQTRVLLDGVPLANAQLGQVDLSLLPTALLDRVDVLHGAASAWHGTSAVGGVVALATPEAHGVGAQVEGETGAFGLRGLTATAQAATAQRSIRVSVAHRRHEGRFRFRLPRRPAQVRANADGAQTGFFATARHGRSRLGLWLTGSERGLPGAAGTQPQRERQHDRTTRLWLRHVQPTARGVSQGGVTVQMDALRYRNPALGLDETGRTHALAADVSHAHRFGPAWRVGSGGEYGLAQADHPSLAQAAREHRASVYGYLERQARPLHVSLALRFDAYGQGEGARTALTGRLGLGLDLTPHLRWVMSGGSSFRTPTFNDRFWRPGGTPSLRPERGYAAETGVQWSGRRLAAEATAYAHAVRDQIAWLPDAAGVWRAGNVGRVRVRGLEASAEWRDDDRPGRPYGGVFYTLTDARDRTAPGTPSFDQPVRYVPHETARLYAGAHAGVFAVDAGVRYTGTRYVQADGEGALDPFFVADVQARARLRVTGGALEAGVVVENVLDVRYSILEGYPMPPRHARFRLGYTWSRR